MDTAAEADALYAQQWHVLSRDGPPQYHPLRQVYRDLLGNTLSRWSLLLVPLGIVAIFWGTRLAVRLGFWCLDKLQELGGRAEDRTLFFAPFQDKVRDDPVRRRGRTARRVPRPPFSVEGSGLVSCCCIY